MFSGCGAPATRNVKNGAEACMTHVRRALFFSGKIERLGPAP